MCSESSTKSLQKLSIDLIDNALKEITIHRKKTSPPYEENFITAEYLLLEAKEYVEGAWDMVSIERYDASIALSRWILEASLNLFWAVADKDEIRDRLVVLAGEALRCDANLHEGLAEIWPSHAEAFKSKAEEARKVRQSLGIDKQLESLDKRLKDIKQENSPKWPELYPLYRICCASAHPSLKVWERYAYSGNSIVGREPVDKSEISSWMAAASTFYLVVFSYCLTGLGDSQQLKDWWEKKVRPLLNEDFFGISKKVRKKYTEEIVCTLKTLKEMIQPRYIKSVIIIGFILIVLTYCIIPIRRFYLIWGGISLAVGPILNEWAKKWDKGKQFLGIVFISIMVALGGLLSTLGWNKLSNFKEDQAMLIAVATEWKIMDACIDRTKKVIQHDASTEGGNKLPYIIFPPLNECSYAITHSETVRCNRDLKNALTAYVIVAMRLQRGFQHLVQACYAKFDNKVIRRKFLESFSRKGGPVDDFMYQHQRLGDYLKMKYPKTVRSAEQQVDTEYLEAFKTVEFLFTIEDVNSIR